MSFQSERLLICGGGSIPLEGLRRLVRGLQAEDVLVIGWGSEEPEEACQKIQCELGFVVAGVPRFSLRPPRDERERSQFLSLLEAARVVFFGGGDQNRIMDVLEAPSGHGIADAIRRRYREGLRIGGTSAGASLLSQLMISGDRPGGGARTRPGLGLLSGTVIDQHFFRRRREWRLRSAVNEHPLVSGIGVEEDGALWVEGGRWCEVVGHHPVMTLSGGRETILRAGEAWDLSTSTRLARLPRVSLAIVPSGRNDLRE